jgi:hypothetical protein
LINSFKNEYYFASCLDTARPTRCACRQCCARCSALIAPAQNQGGDILARPPYRSLTAYPSVYISIRLASQLLVGLQTVAICNSVKMHHSWQGASGSSLTSSPNGVDLDFATQSHYSARANLLFQSEASRSWIDAHYQLHSDDGMNNTCQYDMPVSSPTGSAADSDIGQFGSSLIGHDKIVNLDLLRRFTAAPTIYGSDVDLSGSTPSLRSRGSVKTLYRYPIPLLNRLSYINNLLLLTYK